MTMGISMNVVVVVLALGEVWIIMCRTGGP